MRNIALAAAFAFVCIIPAAPAQTLPIRSIASERTAELELAALGRLVTKGRNQTWRCQDRLGVAHTRASSGALPASVAYRKWVVEKWEARSAACAKQVERRTMEWNWQAFPQWVIDLARCESSVNWYAEGSSSDGVFYSAFNISRSQYDKDAHHMGVRGWNEGPGIPSPYEQAQAVIGHMRLLGDGFTGRCHGIARSSWN